MSGKSSIQQETGQEKERATIWNLPSNTMESILLSCALSSATSSLRNWQISFWNNPVSIPRRKLWFLYEFFTGTLLPLEDADKGNYILLLDPEEYYTLKNGVRSSRHRVINNLTGTVAFCPLIRRTDRLKQVEQTNFIEQCAHILDAYPPELLRRALSYLYTKETKSSFAIEHIKPTPSRREKFVSLLTLAETDDFCERSRLLELQNIIVDARFADTEFRTIQNYVGQTITFQKEIVHYIAPKPEDVESLIEGLVEAHQKMHAGDIPAIVHAAACHNFDKEVILRNSAYDFIFPNFSYPHPITTTSPSSLNLYGIYSPKLYFVKESIKNVLIPRSSATVLLIIVHFSKGYTALQ